MWIWLVTWPDKANNESNRVVTEQYLWYNTCCDQNGDDDEMRLTRFDCDLSFCDLLGNSSCVSDVTVVCLCCGWCPTHRWLLFSPILCPASFLIPLTDLKWWLTERELWLHNKACLELISYNKKITLSHRIHSSIARIDWLSIVIERQLWHQAAEASPLLLNFFSHLQVSFTHHALAS